MNIELRQVVLYANDPKTFYKSIESTPTPSRMVLYMHTIVLMTVVEARYFEWAQGGIVVDTSYDIIRSYDT